MDIKQLRKKGAGGVGRGGGWGVMGGETCLVHLRINTRILRIKKRKEKRKKERKKAENKRKSGVGGGKER